MRFGHTRLNSTLIQWVNLIWEGVNFVGKKNQWNMLFLLSEIRTERRILMQKLEKIKMQFKLRDILQNNSRNECYSFIFQYLKITNLWREYKKIKKGEGSKSF